MEKLTKDKFIQWSVQAHKTSESYWLNEAGLPKERSIDSLLFLVCSELIESGEAIRKESGEFIMFVKECKSHEHWQEIKDLTFPELAGCLLRLFDLFGASFAGKLIYAGYNCDGMQKHIADELNELSEKRMPKIRIKGNSEYKIRMKVVDFYWSLIKDIAKCENEPKKLVRIVFRLWNYCIDLGCDIENLITYADLANQKRKAKMI